MQEIIKILSEFMTEENRKLKKKIENNKKLTAVELDYLNLLLKHKKREDKYV